MSTSVVAYANFSREAIPPTAAIGASLGAVSARWVRFSRTFWLALAGALARRAAISVLAFLLGTRSLRSVTPGRGRVWMSATARTHV